MSQLGFDHGELLNEFKTHHEQDLKNAADLHDQAMAAALKNAADLHAATQAELASEKARHDDEMTAIKVAALLTASLILRSAISCSHSFHSPFFEEGKLTNIQATLPSCARSRHSQEKGFFCQSSDAILSLVPLINTTHFVVSTSLVIVNHFCFGSFEVN